MYFPKPAAVAGISFWTLVSGVQATYYVNTTTPIYTPAVTSSLSISSTTTTTTTTTVALPIVPSSVALNYTLHNTTSIDETDLKTTPVLLSSSTPSLSTPSTLYIRPNATTHENYYNASSTTLSRAYSTPTPNRYSNTTHSKWFTPPHNTTRSSNPTPAPVVLSPALPPSINPHDPVVLQPNRSVSLYYQAPAPRNGSAEIPMASIDIPKMAYPAVVLDHSALISDLECDLNKLRLKFLHRDALDVAKGTWTMPKFVMMAFHEKCGRASETGERDYLLVHKLKFDHNDLSASADISHIDVVEAVGKENPIKLDMGSYTPVSVNGTAGFDSQNAQTLARNGTRTNTTTATDFDTGLDDAIGYTTLSSSQNIKRFAGIDPDIHIVPRGWGFLGKVVSAVVSVAKKVVETFVPSWTLTPINQNIGIGLGGGNTWTPFGRLGYQIYAKNSGANYLRVYCVGCGVNGVINVKATVTFNLLGLVTGGSFSANGWLEGGIGLGVDANYATSIPAFTNTIVSIPLSPFAIPGLITIGPHLDFGVGASAGIVATGNMYAGIRLNWPSVHAQLNLFGAPSASGWIPSTTPEYQAHGMISMSANVYARVSLGFGVSIINGLKSFGVALVEQPELYLGGTTRNTACRGLSISSGFKNTLYADVFGSHYNIAVNDFPGPATCIAMNLRKKRNAFPTLPAPAHVEKRGETRQIKTTDGAIGIHYTDNGNLFALPHGNGSQVDMSTISFSATKEGILTGDVETRIFHGYLDTLGSIGVSRLRLSRPDHIPKTAVAVTLQKSKNPDSPDSLIAVDAAHNVYYPIVCTFGDRGFAKWFLAKDPEVGSKILMDPDNVDDITGLKVDACAYVPFVSA